MGPSPLTTTSLADLRVSTYQIPCHAHLPNTAPHHRPLYIYHAAYPAGTDPCSLESHLVRHDVCPGWRYTMYGTTHYHSTTHEILCVYRGRARLLFGGEANPEKVEAVVGAGDAMVVPAGVGHRLLEDLGGADGNRFMMVGAYPAGCTWDMCYGGEDEHEQRARVSRAAWPKQDPLYGKDGPVLWSDETLSSISKQTRVKRRPHRSCRRPRFRHGPERSLCTPYVLERG